MDRKTLAIVILSVSATLMLAFSIISPPSAQAATAVSGRDYQAVTARAQQGGEALYVLDNKTGLMAVFVYDAKQRSVRVRDVRAVRDAFVVR